MKKVLSLFLSLTMLFSLTAGIDFSASAALKYEVENNNSFSTATNATVGIDMNGVISGAYSSNDTDYYCYNITSTGKLTIKLLHNYNSYGGWNISLFKYDAQERSYNEMTAQDVDCDSGAGVINNIGLKPGDIIYVVISLIYNDGAVGINYTIQTSFEKTSNYETEFNNSFDTANTMTINSPISGNTCGAYNYDDKDYFIFEVFDSQRISLKFTHSYNSGGGWSIKLYKYDSINQSYNEIEKAEIQASKGAYTFSEVGAGTYYVLVSLAYNEGALGVDYSLNAHMHIWDSGTITTQPSCISTGIMTYTCTLCYDTFTQLIPIANHNFGSNSATCLVCGAANPNYVAPDQPSVSAEPAVIDASGFTVKLAKTKYTYNGKVKKPAVTVYDKNGKKLSSSDYTLTYTGNANPGKKKVVIKFKGSYSGTITKYYKIIPKKQTISSLRSTGKKKIKVTWKKDKTVSGYQVQYSTSKKFYKSKSKSVFVSKKNTSKTISKLKSGKKYYVRVRAYKTIDGKKVYGSWSSVKSVKIK